MSICASTDLLSQPLAMILFYSYRVAMGRTHRNGPNSKRRHVLPFLSHPTFARGLGPDTWRLCAPPAVPLVAHDPYFSIWSMADRLNAEGTRHWTGKPNTLDALWRASTAGRYRIMGRDPRQLPALEQTQPRSAADAHDLQIRGAAACNSG